MWVRMVFDRSSVAIPVMHRSSTPGDPGNHTENPDWPPDRAKRPRPVRTQTREREKFAVANQACEWEVRHSESRVWAKSSSYEPSEQNHAWLSISAAMSWKRQQPPPLQAASRIREYRRRRFLYLRSTESLPNRSELQVDPSIKETVPNDTERFPRKPTTKSHPQLSSYPRFRKPF